MTTSMILSIAAALTFALCGFLVWRVHYRGAGLDTGASAWFVFMAFIGLVAFAAMSAP